METLYILVELHDHYMANALTFMLVLEHRHLFIFSFWLSSEYFGHRVLGMGQTSTCHVIKLSNCKNLLWFLFVFIYIPCISFIDDGLEGYSIKGAWSARGEISRIETLRNLHKLRSII